jgi:hypothetical protein
MVELTAESLKEQKLRTEDKLVLNAGITFVGAFALTVNTAALIVNDIASQFEKSAASPTACIGAFACIRGIQKFREARKELEALGESRGYVEERVRYDAFMPKPISHYQKAPLAEVIPLAEPIPIEAEAA